MVQLVLAGLTFVICVIYNPAQLCLKREHTWSTEHKKDRDLLEGHKGAQRAGAALL